MPPQGTRDNTERNRLGDSHSPYLLQHKDNPVHWYPWCDEAFARARQTDRPVFLSIGYSTCHWCHVMAHESFENERVARLMNRTFVPIKVDREERPDVDQVYMEVCQAMTGSGGWPLTIFMTPDRKPFFAATYIPATSRHGRMGLLDLVPRVEQLWRTRRADLIAQADEVVSALRSAAVGPCGSRPGKDVLERARSHLASSFDALHGGFNGAPKFPTPHNLTFLLREHSRTDDAHALEMVERTLRAMRRGGVWDHVGFGFHRYATDARWLVPHFEKMLYDQALLTLACVEAFQVTRDAEYERTAREIITYVLRDMTSPEGGFYCAEDADSEGVEGKFYTWTADEMRDVLGEDAAPAMKAWGVTEDGNYREEGTGEATGRSILHHPAPPAEVARELGFETGKLASRMETWRVKLLDARAARVRPHLDDKVLYDWNALMIVALAKAARALDKPAYTGAAERAQDFLDRHLVDRDGRLLHRWRQGEAGVPAYADDYAFGVWAGLELYETTFDVAHLRRALRLQHDMIERFWDEEGHGFYLAATDSEQLIVRRKPSYDGALPSGNSVAALNLLRLSRLTGEADFESKAVALLKTFAGMIDRAPTAFTQMLQAVQFLEGPAREVVIAGNRDADATRAMLRVLGTHFLPHTVVLLRDEDNASALEAIAPWTRDHVPIDGRSTAYVCEDFTCTRPVTDPSDLPVRLGLAR